MAIFTLRKVNREADRYIATWKLSDGSVVEDELTGTEYADLAKPGAGAPPNRTGDPNAAWLYAGGGILAFDTLSRRLEYGDITDGLPDVLMICAPKIAGTKDFLKVPLASFRGSLSDLSGLSFKGQPVPGVTLVNGVLTVPD